MKQVKDISCDTVPFIKGQKYTHQNVNLVTANF
jgi:hypothetical protein